MLNCLALGCYQPSPEVLIVLFLKKLNIRLFLVHTHTLLGFSLVKEPKKQRKVRAKETKQRVKKEPELDDDGLPIKQRRAKRYRKVCSDKLLNF